MKKQWQSLVTLVIHRTDWWNYHVTRWCKVNKQQSPSECMCCFVEPAMAPNNKVCTSFLLTKNKQTYDESNYKSTAWQDNMSTQSKRQTASDWQLALRAASPRRSTSAGCWIRRRTWRRQRTRAWTRLAVTLSSRIDAFDSLCARHGCTATSFRFIVVIIIIQFVLGHVHIIILCKQPPTLQLSINRSITRGKFL